MLLETSGTSWSDGKSAVPHICGTHLVQLDNGAAEMATVPEGQISSNAAYTPRDQITDHDHKRRDAWTTLRCCCVQAESRSSRHSSASSVAQRPSSPPHCRFTGALRGGDVATFLRPRLHPNDLCITTFARPSG